MPLLMCPNCNEGMQEIKRNEVMIDLCPKCRGVWLDRGEMEKLLHAARAVEAEYEREREGFLHQLQSHGGGHGHYKPHKRKKSLLEQIFD